MADGSMATPAGQVPASDRVTVSPEGEPVPNVTADPTPPPVVRNKPSWATIGTFLILAGAAFIYAKAVLMPVVLAFLLAITFSPIRRAMEKIRIPSGIAAALITVGLLLGLIGAFAGVSAPLGDYVANAPQYLADAEDKLRSVSETVEKVQTVGEGVERAAQQEAADEVQTVKVREPGVAERAASVAPIILAQIVLTLALLFFILASGDMFAEKIVHSIARFQDKRRAVRIIRDIETKLSRYFFTITVINAGLGVAIALAMWALGMPHPYLFGLFAFVFNFVPYIGAVLGVGIATVIGIVTFDEVTSALFAGFVYFLLTSFEGQFVTPYAVGRSLRLNTVVVFIAVAFWGWMWSVIGMIVAMPILIALRVFAEHIPTLYSFGDFLSGRHEEIATARDQAREQDEDEARAAAA